MFFGSPPKAYAESALKKRQGYGKAVTQQATTHVAPSPLKKKEKTAFNGSPDRKPGWTKARYMGNYIAFPQEMQQEHHQQPRSKAKKGEMRKDCGTGRDFGRKMTNKSRGMSPRRGRSASASPHRNHPHQSPSPSPNRDYSPIRPVGIHPSPARARSPAPYLAVLNSGTNLSYITLLCSAKQTPCTSPSRTRHEALPVTLQALELAGASDLQYISALLNAKRG
eukprot:TRINITY_DN10231_c1_g1_i1.p1 TRINITY_DN10231_c1_g1~~TRINITY_DN10231_c1_g1_i1.p1  ORF type:complete len:223 (+),score=22.94 TRINITY_DN10231_c1_g1_i1:43-711(+)